MNKFSVFVVLSVIATVALIGGAMMGPVLAQDNMTITMDGNSTMTMDGNSTTTMDGNSTTTMDHGNMTMNYDNSTDMASNSTM